MQSLCPPSYMAAGHGSHTVVRLLECFLIRRLQLILGLCWWHKVTHSEIIHRAGIPSTKSMLLHRQLCWLGHVIRIPVFRLPKRVLYGQLRLGHRSVGGQKKCFKVHMKSILIKCNIPFRRLEALASNRATWRSTCAFGMSCFDAEYDLAATLRRSRSIQHAAVFRPISHFDHQWPLETMLLMHWPPQLQLNQHSWMKTKSLSCLLDGFQRRRRRRVHTCLKCRESLVPALSTFVWQLCLISEVTIYNHNAQCCSDELSVDVALSSSHLVDAVDWSNSQSSCSAEDGMHLMFF